jgi:hypothetical protein
MRVLSPCLTFDCAAMIVINGFIQHVWEYQTYDNLANTSVSW